MIELRPYQNDVGAEFHRTVADGKRRIILAAPTGAGKTIIGASIIADLIRDLSKSVLVLAHRQEIIKQTAGKLLKAGISHGIIQAGARPRPLERVQVASIQTLWVRAMHTGSMDLPPADLVWVDECHHATARTYRKIIQSYPNAIVLGTSATPTRGDGRGLGGIFEAIIETPQVAELITQSYLVGTRVYAPIDPDLRGVETRQGDYVESQLDERMNRDALVGDIVEHWHKYAERRKTVAFACSVAHSIHIRDEFIKGGVRAEHIDGSTPKPERDATLARLERGEIELVCNCAVLTEGWDMPDAGCCILARPTKKMGLYRQMVGRVLRPADGKPNCIILDHSGATYGMDLSKTMCNGPSIPISVPKAWRIASAASADRACWNAKIAAWSVLAARPAGIADTSHNGRRAPSRSWMASWASSVAIATPTARSTIRPSAPAGTRCWSMSAPSADTSPAGPRTSTRKNSAVGRVGARHRRRFRHRRKSDRGCARE
jgi:superfamily II DNA or RNA helicase